MLFFISCQNSVRFKSSKRQLKNYQDAFSSSLFGGKEDFLKINYDISISLQQKTQFFCKGWARHSLEKPMPTGKKSAQAIEVPSVGTAKIARNALTFASRH